MCEDGGVKRRAFQVEQATRLDVAVSRELRVPEAEALALVSAGAVYIDGRRARAETKIEPGARVLVVLEEGGVAVTQPRGEAPALVVLYEDDDVLAVNKPAGITAQPTPGRSGDSLVDLASAYLKHEAGLVHRLDKETSGVTVFGKHPHATSRLAAAFREGRAQKEYLAIVASGMADEGVIELPLSKDPSRPGRWRATKQANGLRARTRFITVFDDGVTSRVALFPETGRTHQLRAHLTALGFPIVGDKLYGGAAGPRCLLHARVLNVDGLRVEAPLPGDFGPSGAGQ